MKKMIWIAFMLIFYTMNAQNSFVSDNEAKIKETFTKLDQNFKQDPKNIKDVIAFYKTQLPLKFQLQQRTEYLREYYSLREKYQNIKPDNKDFAYYENEFTQRILLDKQYVWRKIGKLNNENIEKSFHTKNVNQVWQELVKDNETLFYLTKKELTAENKDVAVQLLAKININFGYADHYKKLTKKFSYKDLYDLMSTSEGYFTEIFKLEKM